MTNLTPEQIKANAAKAAIEKANLAKGLNADGSIKVAPKAEVKKSTIFDLMVTQKYLDEVIKNHGASVKLSFADSIEKVGLKKILEGKKMEDFELVMLTHEARKNYYLFLVNKITNEATFISRYEGIMECKIYTLKFTQLFNSKGNTKIHYIKLGRKNQAQETISANSKHKEMLAKYATI